MTPVATVTVHSDPAANMAVVAVSVRVAVVVPEVVPAALNPVDPHPLDVLSPDGDAMVKVGNTSSILSAVPVCAIGAFNSNVYEIDDGDHMVGCDIARVLTVSAGTTTAVDFVICTAAIFATPDELSVAAAVRVDKSAA